MTLGMSHGVLRLSLTACVMGLPAVLSPGYGSVTGGAWMPVLRLSPFLDALI